MAHMEFRGQLWVLVLAFYVLRDVSPIAHHSPQESTTFPLSRSGKTGTVFFLFFLFF